jgi:hypothetical protein
MSARRATTEKIWLRGTAIVTVLSLGLSGWPRSDAQ